MIARHPSSLHPQAKRLHEGLLLLQRGVQDSESNLLSRKELLFTLSWMVEEAGSLRKETHPDDGLEVCEECGTLYEPNDVADEDLGFCSPACHEEATERERDEWADIRRAD